ncbi:MAG TPA: hypothetical protein EYH22_03120 [Candidatus Nanopusillus sp.]|nr:hypothetical protein [Candidatus Nanopusillus sp.]
MCVDIVFWKQIGYLVASIIAGFVLGNVLGLLVNRILDRTIERWLDETQIGKELRKIQLDFSDTVGLYTTIFVFLLFLIWGVSQVNIVHPWWAAVVELANYALIVTLGFAFITVALLFVVFLSDYFGRLVRGYNEYVGKLLSILLLVGLIAVVVKLAMGIMGLGYSIITDVINGFVAFSIGWVIADFIIKNIEKDYSEFKVFAPYGKYIILLVFLLVGLNAIFAKYLSTSIIQVLAWGVVFLFAALSLPFILKAIKELY